MSGAASQTSHDTGTGLARYDAMCRAIDAAYEVDEVKAIHDQAKMYQACALIAKNHDAEMRAYEIRMRAARKAGELLKGMEKAKASPGNQYTGKVDRSENHTGPKTLDDGRSWYADIDCKTGKPSPKTLADLGISKQESSDWQKLAAVPRVEFETALAEKTIPALLAKPSPVEGDALLLYGMMHDFDRRWLKQSPKFFMATMTEEMLEDVVRVAPLAATWLSTIKEPS